MKYLMMALALSLTSCVTPQTVTPQQRRAVETRTFEHASYDSVFRAFKSVLQDEGYVIKNQDLAGGLIVASITKTAQTSLFHLLVSSTEKYHTGDAYEVSVNLEAINKKTVEARMVIQKAQVYGSTAVPEQINDPELYKNIYQKVATEVARRAAQGR